MYFTVVLNTARYNKVHKVPQYGTRYRKVEFVYFGTARLVDYSSNHLPLCSLTENMVKRKRYATTEALDRTVINALNVTKSVLQAVYAVLIELGTPGYRASDVYTKRTTARNSIS